MKNYFAKGPPSQRPQHWLNLNVPLFWNGPGHIISQWKNWGWRRAKAILWTATTNHCGRDVNEIQSRTQRRRGCVLAFRLITCAKAVSPFSVCALQKSFVPLSPRHPVIYDLILLSSSIPSTAHTHKSQVSLFCKILPPSLCAYRHDRHIFRFSDFFFPLKLKSLPFLF